MSLYSDIQSANKNLTREKNFLKNNVFFNISGETFIGELVMKINNLILLLISFIALSTKLVASTSYDSKLQKDGFFTFDDYKLITKEDIQKFNPLMFLAKDSGLGTDFHDTRYLLMFKYSPKKQEISKVNEDDKHMLEIAEKNFDSLWESALMRTVRSYLAKLGYHEHDLFIRLSHFDLEGFEKSMCSTCSTSTKIHRDFWGILQVRLIIFVVISVENVAATMKIIEIPNVNAPEQKVLWKAQSSQGMGYVIDQHGFPSLYHHVSVEVANETEPFHRSTLTIGVIEKEPDGSK